ncbi:hypothetical protein OPV22_001713 [Ensete ventricosum]|uniref:Uncharacterized protein n=1 Tax=Ensete ventricosum TaxID=4639 RepID=A0AAV8RLV2_ENSVE|nr:hypothetical protein OPV22_001713 [Ensete ventricosum]
MTLRPIDYSVSALFRHSPLPSLSGFHLPPPLHPYRRQRPPLHLRPPCQWHRRERRRAVTAAPPQGWLIDMTLQ